ncbi:hypothetical protein, partial [Bombiscardovia coagulans]
IMSRVVRVMPPAGEGERAFSRVGVMRKIVFYGLVFLAAFAFGWLVLFDDLRPWARERILGGPIAEVQSGLVVWCFLWRFEDGKGRPGFWFVLLSLPVIIFFGVCFGSIARSDFGVWRWVMVTVGVLVVGALSWFRLVPLVVRNRLGAGAVMVVSCVLPAWMLARGSGSAGASLFWCASVGLVGVLWFLQDLWAIDQCVDAGRDARFEWLAAWALLCDLILLVAALLRSTSDSDND